MGNVQVLSQNTNNGELSEFQKNKLMFDFNTFFDLNNDGYLSYKVNIEYLIKALVSSLYSNTSLLSGFPMGQGPHLSDVRMEDELRQVQGHGEALH